VVFGKIDTEAQPGLATAFQITAIPTLIVMRDGIVLTAQRGMVPARGIDELIAQAAQLDMAQVHQELAAHEAARRGAGAAVR